MKEYNILDLRFTGGELTCRKDWFDILKYAKSLGFSVSCNTNAVFHDPKISELFSRLNLEQVTVSIDGCKENHEYNRGKGTYDTAVMNLKKMSALGVKLRVNTLVNNRSVNDAKSMLDLASQFAEEINFFTVVFWGRGADLEKTDGVALESHLEMSREIKKLKKEYPHIRILHFAEVSQKTAIREDESLKFGLKPGSPSGATTFNISSHGYYSCGGYAPYIDEELFLGNAQKENIFDVWQHNKKLEKMRNDSEKLIIFCNNCNKFKRGDCQGSKYETELIRLMNPEVKNSNCILGDGPSLLKLV